MPSHISLLTTKSLLSDLLIHLPTYPFTYLFTYLLLTYVFTYSLTYLSTHLLVCLFVLITYSPTTHSSTTYFVCILAVPLPSSGVYTYKGGKAGLG